MRTGSHQQINFDIFLAILLILFPSLLLGQHYIYIDDKPYTSDSEIEALYKEVQFIADSIVRRDQNNFSRAYIFESRRDKYVLIDGRNDVFRLDEHSRNISKSSFHGHNFKSKKFVWKDTLFSYGGYGFWRNHGDLIYFDRSRKEWEIEVIPGIFDGMIHWKTFLIDSLIYSFAGLHMVQGKGIEEPDDALHRIDVDRKKYENLGKVSQPLIGLQPPEMFFETEDYHVILKSGNKSLVIDKASLKYKLTRLTFLQDLLSIYSYGFYQIRGNEVRLYDSTATVKAQADMDSVYQSMDTEPKPMISSSWTPWPIDWIGTGLLVFFGLLFYFWMRKSRETKFQHPGIKALRPFDGEVLTLEELDEVFELNHVRQAETKRAKRANYIKEINLEYKSKRNKQLISRERDPEDNRRFIYRIDF